MASLYEQLLQSGRDSRTIQSVAVRSIVSRSKITQTSLQDGQSPNGLLVSFTNVYLRSVQELILHRNRNTRSRKLSIITERAYITSFELQSWVIADMALLRDALFTSSEGPGSNLPGASSFLFWTKFDSFKLIIESATETVEDSTYIQTSHFTCAEYI